MLVTGDPYIFLTGYRRTGVGNWHTGLRLQSTNARIENLWSFWCPKIRKGKRLGIEAPNSLVKASSCSIATPLARNGFHQRARLDWLRGRSREWRCTLLKSRPGTYARDVEGVFERLGWARASISPPGSVDPGSPIPHHFEALPSSFPLQLHRKGKQVNKYCGERGY
ncbi:hypothetical protein I350_04485 [Cryptococcus amylolentus CBS 6273]|uniref:Uncharacterized protein n=1 Tax=Cryptococcus amylolentus CBS 6273 TaxID=1296118 RepID=A0A1E3K243_9TREE|nr:hypothetical protein I350_04485 [Cryptococcus amylolentus CBS 6273]